MLLNCHCCRFRKRGYKRPCTRSHKDKENDHFVLNPNGDVEYCKYFEFTTDSLSLYPEKMKG